MLKLLSVLTEVIYPYRCIICHKIVSNKNQVCSECLKVINIRFVDANVLSNNQMDGLVFCSNYQDVKSCIKAAKYENKPSSVEILGKTMADLWLSEQVDYFEQYYNVMLSKCIAVCVPTDYKRRIKRGYDVPELLFVDFLSKYGIVYKNILRRTRLTIPQFDLNRQQRLDNVANSVTTIMELQGENVILIDDIFTTGASMNEATKVLKLNGACKVIGLAFCSDLSADALA